MLLKWYCDLEWRFSSFRLHWRFWRFFVCAGLLIQILISWSVFGVGLISVRCWNCLNVGLKGERFKYQWVLVAYLMKFLTQKELHCLFSTPLLFHTSFCNVYSKREMWANVQRDGRPAEYRWRPLFNAATFGWRPILECRAVTLPTLETHWNLQGCPKLVNISQPLVDWSSPYYESMWRTYCCLTIFLWLSIHALVPKI